MAQLKSELILIRNIRALMADRGLDVSTVAFAAGHSAPWLSKILSGDRAIRVKDLGTLADVLSVSVEALFSHGTTAATERRRKDRRSGQDRRAGEDRRLVEQKLETPDE